MNLSSNNSELNEHLDPGLIPDNDEQDEPINKELSSLDKARTVTREIIETLVLVVVTWAVVNFLTARVMITSVSMQPNLHEGQRLIVSKLAYHFGDPQRGDIVVFRHPDDPDSNGIFIVKRITGLPGEMLSISGGDVYIDGILLDEPYTEANTPPRRSAQREWTIPEDSYFVMGDNRFGSRDSRAWGFLPRENIVGKAWFSYWPLESIGFALHYRDDNY